MRWSQAHFPTLREDPADAEAPSHRLLVRAGFIRQLMAGVYSILPLGMRVRHKIARVIREELDSIGGQEFLLPALHPGEVWKETGRWETLAGIMFRLKDRRDMDVVLGITHEEIFAKLALELSSYRELPQIWYQIQTKFRDEPRPKGGVLRTREFTMKDSYSFDLEPEGLDRAFDLHHGAYSRIFARLGLEAVPVEASSGAMGGSDSTEFVVASEAGEDRVAHCAKCEYAANLERADSGLPEIADDPGPSAPKEFPTPNVRTIQQLAEFADISGSRQIKTLVYVLDDEPVLVLTRGDHDLNEQKLLDGAGAIDLRPAHPDEVRGILGASPGSLGAVGVTSHRVFVDEALRGRSNMVTGANRDDFHLEGVDVDRDIEVAEWLDLREVKPGEPCPQCGHPLEVFKAIEVGHIFKLGSFYGDTLGVRVQDEHGQARTLLMGSYGIGLERSMAAIVESHHDERGICWPVSAAPFEVTVTVLNPEDGDVMTTADALYQQLKQRGIDVLLDDRAERPGVKFTDAELIGFPYRVTVGPRGLAEGVVELIRRRDGEQQNPPIDACPDLVVEAVEAERT